MDIRAKVLSALRWTTIARLFGQLLSWVITILVIRILSPQDYGLMAMAMVVISLLVLVNALGLAAVLVHNRALSEYERRQIFGVVIIVNVSFCVGLILAAPILADFYNEPRLTDIMRVLALQFVMLIFETIPQSQLERDLDFKNRSIVEFVTMLAGSVLTLILAYMGMGVWALVWGSLVTTATRMLGLNIIAWQPCRPVFSLRGMSKHLAYGRSVAVDRVLQFAFAESDKLIGGKLLGKEALGYYAVASHLASLPIHKLTGLINSVAFPAFSQVQADRVRTRGYMLKASRVMSVLAFPVFFGISSVAEELTLLLLGPKWQAAALPLQIVSLVMPLRMVMNLFQPLLWGVGRPDVSAGNFILAAAIMPLAFVIGAAWGPEGIALGWLVAFPVVFLVSAARTVPLVDMALVDFVSTLARPLAASVVMYAVVSAGRGYAFGQTGEFWHLVQLVVVGGVTYAAVLYMIHRDGVDETLELVQR